MQMWSPDNRREWEIVVYLAVGYWVNSTLHVWYAIESYGGLRLSVPFLGGVSARGAFTTGVVGATAVAVVVGVSSRYVLAAAPSIDQLTLSDVVTRGVLARLVGFGGTLVLTSQVLAGASWSKAVLDIVVSFCALLIVVSSIHPLSLWNLLSLYAAIISVLLAVGGQWLDFVGQLQFPQFPAFTYFALSSIYALVVSGTVIGARNLDPPNESSIVSTEPTEGFPSVYRLLDQYDDAFDTSDEVPADLVAFVSDCDELIEHRVRMLFTTLTAEPTQPADISAELSRAQRVEVLVSLGVLTPSHRRQIEQTRRLARSLQSRSRPLRPDTAHTHATASLYVAREVDRLLVERMTSE